MEKEEREQIDYLLELRNSPIDSKSIMFIENYSAGARGIIKRLFLKKLNDPQYIEYSFIWVCRDYDETIKIFGNQINSKRIWLVESGKRDYIRFLMTAGIIVTAELLPEYYIKRDGQVIYTFLHETNAYQLTYSKGQLQNMISTINFTDSFLYLDDHIKRFLVYQNRIDEGKLIKLEYEELYPEFFCDKEKLFKIEQKNVVLSIRDDRHLKSVAEFRRIRRELEGVSQFYDAEIVCRVKLNFYRDKFIQDEEARINTPDVFSDEYELGSLLEDSVIVITDSLYDAMYATSLGKRAILFYSKSIASHFVRKLGDFVKVDSHESVLTQLESLLRHDYLDSTKDRQKVLIVAKWDFDWFKKNIKDINGLAEVNDLTVLFRSSKDSDIYKYLTSFSKHVKYIVRTGFYQCTERERELFEGQEGNLEEEDKKCIVSDEWKRILGNEHFNLMVANADADYLWEAMYKYAPADDVKLYDYEDDSFLAEMLMG